MLQNVEISFLTDKWTIWRVSVSESEMKYSSTMRLTHLPLDKMVAILADDVFKLHFF